MLHALQQYAEDTGLQVEPGFQPKNVRWSLNFSSEGKYLTLTDWSKGDRKNPGRSFIKCPNLTSQEIVSAGHGCRHFLVDTLEIVMFLTKDDEISDKLREKHDYFVNTLRSAADVVPIFQQIADYLADDSNLMSVQEQLTKEKARPTELITFSVNNDKQLPVPIIDEQTWHDWWRAFRCNLIEQQEAKKSKGKKKSNAPSEKLMRCLMSGELIAPVKTHNKIKGLSDVGGLSMGDTLTSFDKDAFASFSLVQGQNAALSEDMMSTYSAALNDLIQNQTVRLAGAKVAYWYSQPIPPQEDPVKRVVHGNDWEPPEEEDEELTPEQKKMQKGQAENAAKKLLQSIKQGDRPELIDAEYYALTLSANSGRVMIRDWMEGSFPDLVEAVNAWFEDLEIMHREGSGIIRSHKFLAVVGATLRDLKDATAPLITSLWQSAILKRPIPYQVMAQTLQRVRIDVIQDESPRHARLGLLKAFCIRNQELPNMTENLNEHETDPAYLSGRIMAILAEIQQAALKNVGAGVVQRYYAAASVTPALVLGRLVRLANTGHLPKIEQKGLRIWFENQLAEVWAKMKAAPPKVLSLEEQSLFALGYYHQKATRNKKKDSNSEDSNDA